MADQNIIEFRLSGGKANVTKNSSLGGEMSEDPTAIIQSSAILNFFDHVDLPRATSGESEYLCEYVNCKSSTEGLPSVRYWLDRDTLSDENDFSWSLDNTVNIFINQNTILFDGTNDDIDLTNDATLWSTSLTKFSFSFWIYPTLAWDGSTRILVEHGTASTAGVFKCWLHSATSGRVSFEIFNTVPTSIVANSTAVVLNTWNFIVCVYDNSLGSANLKIYVNGVLGGTTGNCTDAINTSNTLTLSAATTDFKGNMKQFKFWKTTPLTQADVNNLYAGNDSSVTTPSYNLKMDEGQGNPIDSISGSKIGTLTNGALWDNTIKTIRPSGNKYIYEPHKTYNGTSDNDSIAHDPSYSLTQFSVGCWFRTSKNYSGGIGYLICKGSPATETAGQNVNYSLRINTSNQIEVYFETSAGVDKVATSSITSNDGKWHYALATYDQVNLRLYIDGMQVGSLAETSAPDTNTKNIFIGAIDGGAANFWQGDIDEVRIWNDDLTAQEQADQYTFFATVRVSAVVFLQKNGNYNGSRIAQVIPNITTAPLLASWINESAEPQGTNLYNPDIVKAGSNNLFNSYIPIWKKRRILANSNSSMDNLGIFKLKGFLRRSNTDQGGGEGGSTPPPTVNNVTFGNGGDSDCNSTIDKLMGVAKTNGATYWLVNGDIVYGSDTKCMGDRISSNFTAGIVVNGNHDGGSKISFWRSIMGTQQNYFRKDIQNICILGMDSEQSFSSGSSQYNFINTELQKASTDNNIDWIIVMIHRPFISQSSTHAENEGNKADIFFPLFTQYHVDLVLQAHNHNIQRSKLLVDNPSNHTSPTIVTSGSTFTKGQGFVVVHNGTLGHDTGKNLYPLNGSAPSWQQYGSDQINAVTLLQWSGTNNAVLTCMIHDINNEMQDTFTIS